MDWALFLVNIHGPQDCPLLPRPVGKPLSSSRLCASGSRGFHAEPGDGAFQLPEMPGGPPTASPGRHAAVSTLACIRVRDFLLAAAVTPGTNITHRVIAGSTGRRGTRSRTRFGNGPSVAAGARTPTVSPGVGAGRPATATGASATCSRPWTSSTTGSTATSKPPGSGSSS